jgi:hypothetical protein
MTPHELHLATKAFHDLQDLEWQRTATLGAWVINCWVKQKVTPEKLLGKHKSLKDLGGIDGMERYWREKQEKGKRG